MKMRIFAAIFFLTALSAFTSSQSVKIEGCHFVNKLEAQALASKYVTKSNEVRGWYICKNSSLNEIQMAILPDELSLKNFVQNYLEDNISNFKSKKVQRPRAYFGGTLYQTKIQTSSSSSKMAVDFYFLNKDGQRFVYIYKDSEKRYRKNRHLSLKKIKTLVYR